MHGAYYGEKGAPKPPNRRLCGTEQTGPGLLLSFAIMAMVRDTSMISMNLLAMAELIELGAC
jgi:hypothetical protein